MPSANHSPEKIAEALSKIGEGCGCYLHNMESVGRKFKCSKHGQVIITAVEVTTFGDKQAEYLVTLRTI